jgi:hypothetical protein
MTRKGEDSRMKRNELKRKEDEEKKRRRLGQILIRRKHRGRVKRM